MLTVLAAASVLQADGQCQQWLVTGDWAMEQSNGYKVSMHTQQTGTSITGTASYLYTKKSGRSSIWGSFDQGDAVMNGKVTGNVAGGDYYAEISFDDGGVGIYRGSVNAQGRIDGTGYPRQKPNEKSNWFSARAMTCKPLPGRIVNFGKPKAPAPAPAPTAPVNTPPAAPQFPAAPYLIARPGSVKLPIGKFTGSTSLYWDGGKDHPYAEVWLKMDGGDERKVLEKGKGSMQVEIRFGTRYTYTLTDNGTTLATVTVFARN